MHLQAPLDSTINFHKGHAEIARPCAIAITAGYAHSSCVTSSGSVLAWASEDPQLRAKVSDLELIIIGLLHLRLYKAYRRTYREERYHNMGKRESTAVCQGE